MEIVAILFRLGQEVVVGHDLAALERSHAWFDDAPCFEIQHAFNIAQCHVEHHAQTRRQALEEPDVRNRRGHLDVTHAFAPTLAYHDFHNAFFDAAVPGNGTAPALESVVQYVMVQE